MKRAVAVILAVLLLFPSVSLALEGRRFRADDYDRQEAAKKRSMVEYMRTFYSGWHNPGLASTEVKYHAETDRYYSVLCVQPPPANVPIAFYRILLGPSSTGLIPLSWYNYSRPAVPPPPGHESLADWNDPMWKRYSELFTAIHALGATPNPLVTTDEAREPKIVTVALRADGTYISGDLPEWAAVWAAELGYPKNCLAYSIGDGDPRFFEPTETGLPSQDTDPAYATTEEDRQKRAMALAMYPPVKLNVGGSWDGMPLSRQVLHAVGQFAVQPKVTLQADTTAWEPGVPINLYLRWEHDVNQPYCPVDIGISVPDFWAIKDGQGADVDPYANGWQNLWWNVQLKPGQAFERWVTVVPGEPTGLMKDHYNIAGIEIWGGTYIKPWVQEKPENAKLTMLRATEAQPARALPPLPARKEPTDNVLNGICPNGMVDTQMPLGQERIKMDAEPPVLRNQDGYKTTIHARIIDLPNRPAAKGAPLSLETSFGQLTNVSVQGTQITATLSIKPEEAEERTEILVTARTADRDQNFLIVPIGGLWVTGQVLNRPGDGSETPIPGAAVTIREVGGNEVYRGETEANGWYKIRLKEAKPVTVAVEAPGYLPAELAKPVPAPGKDDTAEAAPLYLVSRSELELARRRVEEIHKYHEAMNLGDTVIGQQLGARLPFVTEDPTDPKGKITAWLDAVEKEKSPPAHREEGLRRLNLALETARLAGDDAKSYADQVASAAWDDGIGAAVDILKALPGLKAMLKKQGALSASEEVQANIDQYVKINLLPKQETIAEKLTEGIYAMMMKLAAVQKSKLYGDPKVEHSQALVDLIVGKITGWADGAVEQVYKPDTASQKAALELVTGKTPDTLAREIKEVLADWIAMSYLEMVGTELTAALDRAANGQFEEGGYAAAHAAVRERTATLNVTRNSVGITPVDEGLKTFLDGVMKDLNDWGYLAITAVTLGRAAPVLEKVDVGLNVTSALLKGYRFKKGLDLLSETLSTGSEWWVAVEGGVRTAFDGKAGGTVSAKSVALKPGQASMKVGGADKAIDAAPYVAEGRTMVPVRAASEALGAEVAWNGATQEVTLTRAGHQVVMTIGQASARVDGTTKAIDPANAQVVPLVKDGRTYVPLRFLADSLGAAVQWDAATETITLTLP